MMGAPTVSSNRRNSILDWRTVCMFVQCFCVASATISERVTAQPKDVTVVTRVADARDASQVSVEKLNGENEKGILLKVTPDAIVIGIVENHTVVGIRSIPSTEIDRITIERESQFWSGVGTGLLAGVGAGAVIGIASGDDDEGLFQFSAGQKAVLLGLGLGLPAALIGGLVGAGQGTDVEVTISGDRERYDETREDLEQFAALQAATFTVEQSQPELPETQSAAVAPDHSRASRIGHASTESSSRNLHLSIYGGWTGAQAADNMARAFTSSGFGGTQGGFFGPVDYPISGGAPLGWMLEAEYDVSDLFRVGASWSRLGLREVRGKGSEIEEASSRSVGIHSTIILHRVDPTFIGRTELSFRLGVNHHRVDIRGNLEGLFGIESGDDAARYAIRQQVIGMDVRVSLDYYLTRYLSLRGSLGMRTVPKVRVPSMSYKSEPSGLAKNLGEHPVDFSGTDVLVALSFHL